MVYKSTRYNITIIIGGGLVFKNQSLSRFTQTILICHLTFDFQSGLTNNLLA